VPPTSLSSVGFGLAGVSGWLGGALAYHDGVGVRSDAYEGTRGGEAGRTSVEVLPRHDRARGGELALILPEIPADAPSLAPFAMLAVTAACSSHPAGAPGGRAAAPSHATRSSFEKADDRCPQWRGARPRRGDQGPSVGKPEDPSPVFMPVRTRSVRTLSRASVSGARSRFVSVSTLAVFDAPVRYPEWFIVSSPLLESVDWVLSS